MRYEAKEPQGAFGGDGLAFRAETFCLATNHQAKYTTGFSGMEPGDV